MKKFFHVAVPIAVVGFEIFALPDILKKLFGNKE